MDKNQFKSEVAGVFSGKVIKDPDVPTETDIFTLVVSTPSGDLVGIACYVPALRRYTWSAHRSILNDQVLYGRGKTLFQAVRDAKPKTIAQRYQKWVASVAGIQP
jgi:hypothetical protein